VRRRKASCRLRSGGRILICCALYGQTAWAHDATPSQRVPKLDRFFGRGGPSQARARVGRRRLWKLDSLLPRATRLGVSNEQRLSNGYRACLSAPPLSRSAGEQLGSDRAIEAR